MMITLRMMKYTSFTPANIDRWCLIYDLYQGESEDELPERLIGSARIVRPDLDRAEPLDS